MRVSSCCTVWIKLRIARAGGKLHLLAEQAQTHADARDRRAQFMRGTQHELAAHLVELALRGYIAHHHDHAGRPLSLSTKRFSQ